MATRLCVRTTAVCQLFPSGEALPSAGPQMGSTHLPPTFDPREEPGALAAHAGICAGGEEQSSSLPRPSANRHSITSSARASTVSGIVRPSAFAVLRLIINSYLGGARTGRSADLSPLRIRST